MEFIAGFVLGCLVGAYSVYWIMIWRHEQEADKTYTIKYETASELELRAVKDLLELLENRSKGSET